jgi:hypothetical protein
LVNSWQVSFKIDVPDSRYPYVKKVDDAILKQPDAFKETLRQKLLQSGIKKALLTEEGFSLTDFTGLQGPAPTTTKTSTTTTTTTITTTTTTVPWTKLTGFFTMVATEATQAQLEKAVKSTLGMRLNIPESKFLEVSVFPEERRLLALNDLPALKASQLVSRDWDASYAIRALDKEVKDIKNLAHFISKDPGTFVSTLKGLLKGAGLQKSSLTKEALKVVVFSELQGDTSTSTSSTTMLTTTTATLTVSTVTVSTATVSTVALAAPQDVPLDESMDAPDVGPGDGEAVAQATVAQQFASRNDAKFDCDDGETLRSGWSPVKISWCCENQQIGCEALTQVTDDDPYDCQAGLNNWKRGWSQNKMDWCCSNKQLGCTTTSGRATKDDQFDCEAGYDHWERGWSEKKKSWCCENKKLGCNANEDDTNLV